MELEKTWSEAKMTPPKLDDISTYPAHSRCEIDASPDASQCEKHGEYLPVDVRPERSLIKKDAKEYSPNGFDQKKGQSHNHSMGDAGGLDAL